MHTKYAGFWLRGFAFAVDLILLQILFFGLTLMGHAGMEAGLRMVQLDGPSNDLVRFIKNLFWTTWILSMGGYFTYFHVCGGQTPGKMFFKIRVVNRDHHPLNWQASLLRTLGYLLSGPLLMGLGFLLIVLHPSKKALHDLISGTWVEHHVPADIPGVRDL